MKARHFYLRARGSFSWVGNKKANAYMGQRKFKADFFLQPDVLVTKLVYKKVNIASWSNMLLKDDLNQKHWLCYSDFHFVITLIQLMFLTHMIPRQGYLENTHGLFLLFPSTKFICIFSCYWITCVEITVFMIKKCSSGLNRLLFFL